MLNVEKIQELLGNEYTCEAFTERKNNLTLNRVNIQKNGMNIGMCLNLSDQFETENELVNFFLEKQTKFCVISKKADTDYQNKIKIWAKAKENVFMGLYGDPEYASEYFNKPFKNLFMIPYICFENAGGIVVSTKIKRDWYPSVPKEIIFQTALENTEKEACFYDMEDLICGFLHDEEQKDPENLLYQHVEGNSMLYVLTNEDKSHGASVFLCDTVQKKLQEVFPEGCYIIPSSIHECIVANKNMMSPSEVLDIVQEMNDTNVEPCDKLSDSVYIFKEGKITAVF